MNRTWTLSFVIVAFTAQLWAGKPSAGPPPPSAILFGTSTPSGEVHEELWFRLASITFTRTMTVPEDGAWLYGDAISNRSFPNTICGKRWIATVDPSVPSYVPFFRLGMVPGDVCGPTGYCLACGVRFGGTYTSPRTALVTHPGTHSITVATENGGGMNDAVQLWLAQVNRSDMQNMSIYRAKSETDASPATAADLTGEYFIANSPEEVLVVPKFHHAREFPAGPGLTYTATWDGATVSAVEVYTPGADIGDRVLGVAVPKLATGIHEFTVTATLASGKTYTSNPLEVFVYAQTIYVTFGSTFDAKNPVDELAAFVPGSTSSGTSIDLMAGPQIVFAHILVGRGSSGTFTAALRNVSSYPGVAMNYPIEDAATTPDVVFENGLTTQPPIAIPKGGKPVVVTIPLHVRDYAASATIEVEMPYRKTTFTSRRTLPIDANANGLPDAGWYALANSATGAMNKVADAYSRTSDAETDPLVSGIPAQGITGDGLTAVEEYRGFFVRGAHRRLHPLRKDLFVMVAPIDDTLDDRLGELPLTLHEVRPGEALGEAAPVINPNRAGMSGTSLQRGIRARNRYPSPLYEKDDGTVVPADFEALGWTFQLEDNINLINAQMASLALVRSANETLVAEVFDYGFWRHFISYGPNGLRETHVASTDEDVPEWAAIYGGSNWLQSVPNSADPFGDDFQTHAIHTVCGNSPDRPSRLLTVDELLQSYQNTFLHEVAHGLDVEHDRLNCSQSLMSDEAAVPVVRSLTPNDITQIRIHRKHN